MPSPLQRRRSHRRKTATLVATAVLSLLWPAWPLWYGAVADLIGALLALFGIQPSLALAIGVGAASLMFPLLAYGLALTMIWRRRPGP